MNKSPYAVTGSRSTKKPSTKKPSTKKPSTKKPSTKKPSTKKPSIKAFLSKRPVLWFLFLFNAVVAVVSYLTMDGAQGIATAVGMGLVALGAGGGLITGRRKPVRV